LALVLRLAVILHRGRDPQIAPPAWLEVAQGEISLYCDADWLEERPLTQADLAREAELLARADIKLKTLPEA
jgi:exopolyphosphatase/guanosine-5'-triphosphate,3'-diphosphate pyrophosphatase